MTQLVADEAAAVGGDPVETTTETPQPVADNPEEPEGEPEGEIDLYPDDQPKDEDEGDFQDDDEGLEADEPPIQPPLSWKAEDKAEWDNLPRSAQETIARRETERETFLATKAKEAAEVKTTVVEQAKTEIADFRERMASEYQALAQRFEPQAPDERLLFTGNHEDAILFQQQKYAYELSLAQQYQLQQAAQHEQTEAQRIREEQERAARDQDDAILREKMPAWFSEGEEGKKLQTELKSIALDLGYSDELWEQRNSSDVLALSKAHAWKSDAEKWRSYQRNKMAGVRSHKGKLPPVTKPGAAQMRQQSADPVKLLYPND